MTLIGNSQNLLIAIDSGIDFPLLNFLLYIGAPTAANLLVTYLILRRYFRQELASALVVPKEPGIRPDARQARLAIYVTVATLGGVCAV
jgi:Na+/H+ antiporter NhaD/arsenite permease-like protein